jgi:hypothetical protein
MIWFGEEALRKAIQEFVLQYHHEQNHQGLIAPTRGDARTIENKFSIATSFMTTRWVRDDCDGSSGGAREVLGLACPYNLWIDGRTY